MFSEWEPAEVAEIVAMCWSYAPKNVHMYFTSTYLDNPVYDVRHRELWCYLYACISLRLERGRASRFKRKRMVGAFFWEGRV